MNVARKNLYVPDADMPKVRRLERMLKLDRMSLSEWFIRRAIEALAQGEARGLARLERQ